MIICYLKVGDGFGIGHWVEAGRILRHMIENAKTALKSFLVEIRMSEVLWLDEELVNWKLEGPCYVQGRKPS